MDRTQVAALLAYAVRLDPRLAPTEQAEADERLDQWAELLADVPPTAPHPDGRDWNAAHVVRHHIATSPYRIQPSDIGGPWAAFRRDVLGRHTDPVPAVDPDNAKAYRAALAGTRRAIETGQAAAVPYRAELMTGGPAKAVQDWMDEQRDRYMPAHVADQFALWRKTRAQRERLAAAGLPDPLAVACPHIHCRAAAGKSCQTGSKHRHDRDPHPSRIELATAQHYAKGSAA